MALKVKPVEASATKWSERGRAAAAEYATEAEAAASTWEAETKKAQSTFRLAIQATGLDRRWLAGITRAGATKYGRKIRDVGADRFAPGIEAALPDYTSQVSPYFAAIAGLTLTARKPRGDPGNYRRVEEVGKALNAKRLALLGGGS